MGADLDLSAVYETATPAGQALIDLHCQVLNGGFTQWFDNCEPTPETFERLAFGLGRIPLTVLDRGNTVASRKLAERETVARGQLVRGALALVKLAGQALVRRPTVRLRVGFAWRWEATVEPLDDLYYSLDSDALMAFVAEHLTEEPTDEPCCHCEGSGLDSLWQAQPTLAARAPAGCLSVTPRPGRWCCRPCIPQPAAVSSTLTPRSAPARRGSMKHDEESRFPGQPGYEELAALLENRS